MADGKYLNIQIVPSFKVLFIATGISYESCEIMGFVFNIQGLCHLICFLHPHIVKCANICILAFCLQLFNGFYSVVLFQTCFKQHGQAILEPKV